MRHYSEELKDKIQGTLSKFDPKKIEMLNIRIFVKKNKVSVSLFEPADLFVTKALKFCKNEGIQVK